MGRRRFWKLSLALPLAVAAIPLGAQPVVTSLASSSVFGNTPAACPLPAGITAGATLNQVNVVGFTLCINGAFTPALFQSITWAPASGAPTVFTLQTTELIQTTTSQIELVIPPTLWSSLANVGNVVISVTEFFPAANQPRSSSALFRVNAPLAGSGTALPTATVGVSYAQSLYSGGTAPFVNTLLSGAFPPGLTLPAGGTTLTGVPTQAGPFTFRFSVTDAWSTALAQTDTITVNASPPVINTPSVLPVGVTGAAYSVTFNVTGGTPGYLFAIISGALPSGLTLSASGTLSGTPTAAGQFVFSLQVKDSAGATASQVFNLHINSGALSIATVSPLPAGQLGAPYSAQFNATGGTPPFTWTATGVPAGLIFSNAGLLSGTPTASGTFTIAVTVTDSARISASGNFSLTVGTNLAISTASLPNGTVGTAYTASVAATGGVPPYTFSATGLPGGITLSTGGTLSGTPTAAGTFTVTVTVRDAVQASVTKPFPVIIAPAVVPALAIATASLPNGTAGAPYAATVSATGGVPPYRFTAAGLPPPLTIDSGGTLSGTPSVAGTFNVTVVVNDSRSVAATKSYTVIIAPLLTVSTASLPGGVVGSAYSATLAANGGTPPYTWSAASLPAGLKLAADGTLTGTPTAAGTTSVAATVTDSNGVKATQTLQVTIVLPAAPAVTVNPNTTTTPTQQTLQITAGAAYPLDITVTLTLTFAGDSGRNDPAVLFANNSRTTQVVIPAGTTSAPSVGVQTGTVAGTITIAAALQAGGQSITPAPAPRTITILAAAPVIATTPTITATRNSTGFTVVLNGYATSLEVTQATFTFTAGAGANLQTGQVTVPVTALFAQWYQSSASAPFGSQFTFTQPFTVQGSPSDIVSVTVTLTNSNGTSAPTLPVNLQ